MPQIIAQEKLEEEGRYWKRLCIFVGVDCFFNFISSNEVRQMVSGFYVIHTNADPIITGKEYKNKFHNYDEDKLNWG